MEAGLIEGSKLHTDSSLVRADASLNSVVAGHSGQAGGECGGGTEQEREWSWQRRSGQSEAPGDDRSGLRAGPADKQREESAQL